MKIYQLPKLLESDIRRRRQIIWKLVKGYQVMFF